MVADTVWDVVAAVRILAMLVSHAFHGGSLDRHVRIMALHEDVDRHVEELPGKRRKDRPDAPTTPQE
jgi:hypothetical protein